MQEFGLSNFIKNNKVPSVIFALVLIAVLFYLNIRLRQEKSYFDGSIRSINEENRLLKQQSSQLQSNLLEKEKKLADLKDAQAMKFALNSAQMNIESMNSELNKLRSEKTSLQESNIALSNRMQSTTREFTKTFEELRHAKEELASIDKLQIAPLKKKIEELSRMQDDRNSLIAVNRSLEEKIAGQSKNKTANNASTQALTDNIAQLNAALAEKESQLRDLEARLSESSGQNSVAYERQAKTGYREGESDRKDLKSQISRISVLLTNKELELDKIKKDNREANEKVANLQARVSVMERDLNESQIDKDKLKQIESEKLNFQLRLQQIQEDLKKKGELADSLQSNLVYLNQQLSRKEEEKKSLESKLAKSSEMETLYNNLRSQVLQLSEFVNTKDRELDQRQKDVESFKEEVSNLKTQSLVLEKELAEARERQKKTLDDLSMTLKLNAALQERLSDTVYSDPRKDNSKEKERTEELKRKIEVILSPDNR